jgi:hypothetical protein
MTIRAAFVIALLWVASLFMVGHFAAAQSFPVIPLREPRIMSGPDFGIRVEGERNGTPVGVLVVRINGQWVEAQQGSAKPTIPLVR